MKICLASIAARRSPKSEPTEFIAAEYLQRTAHIIPAEGQTFPSESALLTSLEREQARTPTHLILLDPRGKLLSSEAFAAHLGRLRDTGTQRTLVAIGPADGWSSAALARADLLLSLGPMTLPHELARVIIAEQIYRAFTILVGHPYHTGH